MLGSFPWRTMGSSPGKKNTPPFNKTPSTTPSYIPAKTNSYSFHSLVDMEEEITPSDRTKKKLENATNVRSTYIRQIEHPFQRKLIWATLTLSLCLPRYGSPPTTLYVLLSEKFIVIYNLYNNTIIVKVIYYNNIFIFYG